MTLRPIAAHWFELLTAHGQLARTMECLSRTGAVELEARSGREERVVLPDVSEQLKAHHELARRYQSYWPDAIQTPRPRTEALNEILKSARNRLEAWAQEADPVIVSIERISREINDLDQLNEALKHGAAVLPNLRLLVAVGPKLAVRLVRLAAGSQVRELPALVLFRRGTRQRRIICCWSVIRPTSPLSRLSSQPSWRASFLCRPGFPRRLKSP